MREATRRRHELGEVLLGSLRLVSATSSRAVGPPQLRCLLPSLAAMTWPSSSPLSTAALRLPLLMEQRQQAQLQSGHQPLSQALVRLLAATLARWSRRRQKHCLKQALTLIRQLLTPDHRRLPVVELTLAKPLHPMSRRARWRSSQAAADALRLQPQRWRNDFRTSKVRLSRVIMPGGWTTYESIRWGSPCGTCAACGARRGGTTPLRRRAPCTTTTRRMRRGGSGRIRWLP